MPHYIRPACANSSSYDAITRQKRGPAWSSACARRREVAGWRGGRRGSLAIRTARKCDESSSEFRRMRDFGDRSPELVEEATTSRTQYDGAMCSRVEGSGRCRRAGSTLENETRVQQARGSDGRECTARPGTPQFPIRYALQGNLAQHEENHTTSCFSVVALREITALGRLKPATS